MTLVTSVAPTAATLAPFAVPATAIGVDAVIVVAFATKTLVAGGAADCPRCRAVADVEVVAAVA
jgi:hypothetical protein